MKYSINSNQDQKLLMKGLSKHECLTEQEGIDYLLMGNFLRQVSATEMNNLSSRSHCLFIISLETTDLITKKKYSSKINLVDLAGSERLDKTTNSKQLQKETKKINLSLTYLEQVIISLTDKKHLHIPYRNSLLTTVLKDSLGGNCKTVMISCLSLEIASYEETLSSCRFSKRCAKLENSITQNEHIDKDLLIKNLMNENLKLKK